MKKIISVLIVFIMVFFVCSCSKTATASYDIENDIANIKSIFACVDIETLAEKYSEEITSYDDLTFEGTFAGINGIYEIELYEEGDNELSEAGEIYSVNFSWDYNQNIPIDEIAEALSEYLGKPSYSDAEWGSYCWMGSDMTTTKFNNEPFGNCFDVEMYGDDGYIYFGISTTI